MKKILITGINGMIGSILAESLAADQDIFGLDLHKYLNPDIKTAKNIDYFSADISASESLEKVFSKIGHIDMVIHLAADPYPFAAWENVLKHNLVGTKNLYEVAENFGVKRVIFASSTHAVGKYPGFPVKPEDRKMLTTNDPVRPDEWYGASKAMGETIARTYFDLFGLESIILRIGHVTAGDDNSEERLKKLFLSHADLVNLVNGALETKVKFGVYFAVSDVPGRFLDITNAIADLGYRPIKQSV